MRLHSTVAAIPWFAVALAGVGLVGCGEADRTVHESVHTFYYGWYANEETDGEARHWNHDVLGVDEPARFPGGDDIGANYYPTLGTYSSTDATVVRTHLRQCADAGIGVVVASWWGEGSFEDEALPLLFDSAEEFDIRIAFHLEPIPGRGAETSRHARGTENIRRSTDRRNTVGGRWSTSTTRTSRTRTSGGVCCTWTVT